MPGRSTPHSWTAVLKQKGLFILFEGVATPATVMFISIFKNTGKKTIKAPRKSKGNAGHRVVVVCLFSC